MVRGSLASTGRLRPASVRRLHRCHRRRERLAARKVDGAGADHRGAGDGGRTRPFVEEHQPEQGGEDEAAVADRHQLGRRRQAKALDVARSEEHTSELQSLMRISYAVFCLKKTKTTTTAVTTR